MATRKSKTKSKEPDTKEAERLLERLNALEPSRMGADTLGKMIGVAGWQLDELKKAGALPSPGVKGKRTQFSPLDMLRHALIVGLKNIGLTNQASVELAQYLDGATMWRMAESMACGQEVYLTCWFDGEHKFTIGDASEITALMRATSKPLLTMCVSQVFYMILRVKDQVVLADEFAKAAGRSPRDYGG